MKMISTLAIMAGLSMALSGPVLAAETPTSQLAKMMGQENGALPMGDFTSVDGSISYKGATAAKGGLLLKDVSFERKGVDYKAGELQASKGYLEFTNLTIDGTGTGLGKISVGNLRSMGPEAYALFDSFDMPACGIDHPELAKRALTQMSAKEVSMLAPADPLTAGFAAAGLAGPETLAAGTIETSWRSSGGDAPCLDLPAFELSKLAMVDATGGKLAVDSLAMSSAIAPREDQDYAQTVSLGGAIAKTADGDRLWQLDSASLSVHGDEGLVTALRDAHAPQDLANQLTPDFLIAHRGGVSLSLGGMNIPNPMADPTRPAVSPRLAGDATFDAQMQGSAVSIRSDVDVAGLAKSRVAASFTIENDATAKAASQAFSHMAKGGDVVGALSLNGAKASYLDQGLRAMLEARSGKKIGELLATIHRKIGAKAPAEVADAVNAWLTRAMIEPQGAKLTVAPEEPTRLASIAMSMMMNPASLVDLLKIETN